MLRPTDDERKQIIEVLVECPSAAHTGTEPYDTFLRYYDSIICPFHSSGTTLTVETAAIRDHSHLLDCILWLRSNPGASKKEFMASSFRQGDVNCAEKEWAARQVIKVAFMIDCASKNYYSEGFKIEAFTPVRWEDHQPFVEFLKRAFSSGMGQGDDHVFEELTTCQKALKAWKLVKRHQIKLRATSDLLEHLLFDPKRKVLKVFHHTAFLRAHLQRTKGESLDLGCEESIRQGTLPPRLLFETLVSFQSLLFPIASAGSSPSLALLRRLIDKQGFDKDGLWHDLVRPMESDFTFTYLGPRLKTLHDAVKHPSPANAMISWVERHTSERNALTVAITGLFLAVLFGLLAIVIGSLQLVVAWMAWKYPVIPGP